METIGAVYGFNTTRLYAADGQRISYNVDSTGVVRFKDHSRMIDGVCRQRVELDTFYSLSREGRAAAVMARYDACEYDYDRSGIAQMLNAAEWPRMRVTNN
jgi:hypothetical protein